MSDTAVEVLVSDPETHDDDNVAHIVTKEAANEGYLAQVPIEALCGYIWIPKQDPEKLPICHKCMEVMKRHSNRDFN